MSPVLRDYALLWSTATASRDTQATWTFRVVAAVFPLIVGLLVWSRTDSVLEAVKFGVRVPVAVFLFAALTFYVPGAIRLNTPANARLVPRMRRRLIELTTLVWVVATAMAVLIAWDTPAPAATVAMATLAWLVGLGLASAGCQAGTYIQCGLLIAIVLRQHLPGVPFQPALVVALGLLLLALAARTLELMFPNGGDRHWERRHAQARAIERAKPEGLMRQASVTLHFGGSLYAAALRRNSARPHAPAFLLPVLGPTMHWTQRYIPLLALVGMAVAVIILAKAFAAEALFKTPWLVLVCLTMLFAQLFTYEQRRLRLADTRTEQTLLRMAPAVPAAARQFNRQLNRSLLGMALLDWVAIATTLLVISAALGRPLEGLVFMVQICCLTLPLTAANVRNHASEGGSALLRLVGGLVGALVISIGGALLVQRVADTPVLPVAAGFAIVLAVIVGVWRWRRAVAAPHAFPAGRLA